MSMSGQQRMRRRVTTAYAWCNESDLRGEMTLEAAVQMAASHPVALLCEGTRLTGPNATTEAEVYENCRRVIDDTAGKLAIAEFAPRYIEQFEILARIPQQNQAFQGCNSHKKRRFLPPPLEAGGVQGKPPPIPLPAI